MAASKILLKVTNFKRPGGAIPVAFAIDGDALSRLQVGSSAGQLIYALVAFRDDGEPARGATDTTRDHRFAVMHHDNDHDGS